MLPAEDRKLYIEALAAPSGYELEEALCTTYSLSLESLLTVPVSLALGGLDPKKLGEQGDVWILEAIRRVASRLTVFCDTDCIGVPTRHHVLYGLLERAVVPVRAPNGGAFHPKVWVLRFAPVAGDAPPWVRILVLTRNLSPDRSWDLSLQLEGKVKGAYVAALKPLGQFVQQLVDLGAARLPSDRAERLSILADEVRRIDLELPRGYEEIAFHILGFEKRAWMPERSERLLVVSPFLSGAALDALVRSTAAPVALVARAEELDAISPASLAPFEAIYTLHEAAQSEDGEDTTHAGLGPSGLHAKLYVAKRGWNTHVYVGSANATHAAMLSGANVELMAELIGKTSKVDGKGIDGFLDASGMRNLLVPYTGPLEAPEIDEAREDARRALERLGRTLEDAGLALHFDLDGADVTPSLRILRPIDVRGVAGLRTWLVTTEPGSSTADAMPLLAGQAIALPRCGRASSTRFVAFEASSDGFAGLKHTFVLALAATGLPADRDDAIAQSIVNNRDRFLLYLQALLAGLDEDGIGAIPTKLGAQGGMFGFYESGLLERLMRARNRHPERLRDVKALVDSLSGPHSDSNIIPPDFLEAWAVIAGDLS